MKKLIISLAVGACMTGCADATIHQFINSDFLNVTAPNVATLGKSFYPERYSIAPKKTVPATFANAAPDRIDRWVFIGFTGLDQGAGYAANYYDPTSVKVNGTTVTVDTFAYYSDARFTRSKKPFMSVVFENSIDCNQKTIKLKVGAAYSSNRPVGVPVSRADLSKSKQAPITNDSLDERLWKKVCQ